MKTIHCLRGLNEILAFLRGMEEKRPDLEQSSEKLIEFLNQRLAKEEPPESADFVILTKPLIRNLYTNGSFTNATLNYLPVPRKPTKGWPNRLIGQKISRKNYEKALAGRGVYKQARRELVAV